MKKYYLPALLTLFLLQTTAYAQELMQPADVKIDFSFAGYAAGKQSFPAVVTMFTVSPTGKDDTQLLQQAIDKISNLPLQSNGTRGGLHLRAGNYKVSGSLQIRRSGIVLRGEKGTVIVATGTNRRNLITIGSAKSVITENTVRVTDNIVPAGSLELVLENTAGLKAGDRIIIRRPSTRAWISSLGMDTLKGTFAELRYQWNPGSRDLVWDRIIVSVDTATKRIALDAPITTALETKFGGAELLKAGSPPAQNIAISGLILQSEYDKTNLKDEEHAWTGISIDNAEDVLISDVSALHFTGSGFRVGQRARRVTVVNCVVKEPVGEAGGYRRRNFFIEGQQVLVYNCRSEEGMNDFATGLLAAGPNVFFNCNANKSLGASGPMESWASGVLYENVNVNGAAIKMGYDIEITPGAGWTAVNSLIWNSKALFLDAKGPESAMNHVVSSSLSLFQTQLKSRAAKLPQALSPVSLLTAKTFIQRPVLNIKPVVSHNSLQIVNGRFVIDNKTMWGGSVNDAWWLGKTLPEDALTAGISITRFVPGKTGPGLTEDLPELADRLKRQGMPFYQSGPAIWYDRRRDDHTIAQRTDANVWAAFYELPWARSGSGKAWDGLSKYDLTKYNPWYFNRIKEFAMLCDEKGIILYHHLYNNHNLLETAAHWADFPWRPANNINETGLPEPPPLEAKNTLHLANQFYDVTNPKLYALHKAYIFHVLDELAAFKNIVFGLSFQYSGPLEFQKFFQQTVAEWQKKHGRKVRLLIDTGKDLTDAILTDPQLSKQISVIDMRYWHYLPDGTLWAPKAGQNRAFRELHPKEFGDPGSPQQIYRQVREYRDKYPDKALVSWHSGVDAIPALMAGGSQVLMRNPTAGHGQGKEIDRNRFDVFVQQYLQDVLMTMKPVDGAVRGADNWVLANKDMDAVLIYSLSGDSITFTEKLPRDYTAIWFNPKSGQIANPIILTKGQHGILKPENSKWLLYLKGY